MSLVHKINYNNHLLDENDNRNIIKKKTVYIIINSNPRINIHEKILSLYS